MSTCPVCKTSQVVRMPWAFRFTEDGNVMVITVCETCTPNTPMPASTPIW